MKIYKITEASDCWRRNARGSPDTIGDEIQERNHPMEQGKKMSVEDMQKIVDANEKLVKELKDGE